MEEYVWISKVTHDSAFSDRSHPILLRLAQHYSVDISITGPETSDTESCIKAVYDAIRRKIAGLMIVGWGNDNVVPAVDAAVDNGIPVVCVGTDIPRSKRHAYVGTDWYRMGASMAALLADFINNRGKVLTLGAFELDHVMDGVQGFRKQIDCYPDIEVLAPIDNAAANPKPVNSIIADYLRIHSDLKGIVGLDAMPLA